MPVLEFPGLNETPENQDYAALGGDLEIESLLLAYRSGIFPWPDPHFPELIWASPAKRALLFFSEIHIPKRLERSLNKSTLTITINKAFPNVIESCAKIKRKSQKGTWITDEMLNAYIRLHELGYAHSFEAWNGKKLVGGVYGVAIDGVFSAESMFHKETDASKIVLIHLIHYLQAKGCAWLDIQVLSPLLETLGARTIPRKQFLSLLKQEHSKNLVLF